MHIGGDALAFFQGSCQLKLMVQIGIDQGDRGAVCQTLYQLHLAGTPLANSLHIQNDDEIPGLIRTPYRHE